METLSKTAQELKFSWKWLESNDYPSWAANCNKYTVTISKGDTAQEFNYFRGRGLSGAPELQEVLETLISDWQTLEGSSDFTEWADNVGYNSDSIKDREVYYAIIKQSEKLLTLITEQEAQELYEVYNA